MKITWLGQAGLLFETGNKKIIVECEKMENRKNGMY